jgi:3-deoxy-D-manno-octulosonate 8-phosphate phosphatase (KDO 8-P phosphatase)
MWQKAGLKVALLSGRFSEATKRRAEQLEVDFCIQDCFEKLPALKKLLGDMGISANDTAYIGDDLLDLPAIKYVGFGAAVANAVDEVKDAADYITKRHGGDGAVREVIEYILKNSGPLRRGRIAASKWQELMKKYR